MSPAEAGRQPLRQSEDHVRGIPFPVLCRASFGTRGANIPALFRALVACGWFGIQCWIGGEAIHKILGIFFPSIAGAAGVTAVL